MLGIAVLANFASLMVLMEVLTVFLLTSDSRET